MVIQITTRQLFDMLTDAYKRGAMMEKCKDPQAENLDGAAQDVAQSVLNKHQWTNDFIVQQS